MSDAQPYCYRASSRRTAGNGEEAMRQNCTACHGTGTANDFTGACTTCGKCGGTGVILTTVPQSSRPSQPETPISDEQTARNSAPLEASDRERATHCPKCGLLVMQPDVNYGINPDAVCKCLLPRFPQAE